MGWTETKAALLARFKHPQRRKHLAALTNLRSLRLSYSKVTDAGLKHLVGLKELRVLDLSEHGFAVDEMVLL